jgi:Ni,Fe-hydrogenase III large subunit/Ni,Fe-hydrogenase III component G
MSEISYQALRKIGQQFGVQIHRPGNTQLHYLVQSSESLMEFCQRLHDENCFLVTVVANDERELEDDCFKLYYIFSHPTENVFLVIEFSLQPGRETYPSIYPIYPAVEPFEREMADLLGLLPEQKEPRIIPQSLLHSCYPAGLYPLRRDCTQASLRRLIAGSNIEKSSPPSIEGKRRAPAGELYMPVGPVHAGVIEPGNFTFRISGEVIEGMDVLLGYKHRGVERLYQRNYGLCTGWKLAEQVAGDSSFSHSVAYSKAVEVMSSAVLPQEAHLLRGLLLEIERMVNHIGDCAALVQDLALSVPAAAMSVLRERMIQLCGSLTGSRYLRGVNQPGGIVLPGPLDILKIRLEIQEISGRFLNLAYTLAERWDFRERTIGTGVLPRETVLLLGVTGLAARASGVQRDYRILHPFGLYATPEVQALLMKPAMDSIPIPWEASGDVFSRFMQRVTEVKISEQLVALFLNCWTGGNQNQFFVQVLPERMANFEWGMGYVEGWRGDIVYWVMKDKFERIYRCKVRDPSTLNWPGLKAAIASEPRGADTALVDFPVINKSFNLSYAGNDL